MLRSSHDQNNKRIYSTKLRKGAQVVAEYSHSVSVPRQISFGKSKYYKPGLFASWISYVLVIPNRP